MVNICELIWEIQAEKYEICLTGTKTILREIKLYRPIGGGCLEA